MAMTATFTVDCEAVQEFLAAWHEAGRAHFCQSYLLLDYDKHEPKTAKDRKKYVALDRGTSGEFLLDKETGSVWTISAYGRPNKRWAPSTLEELTKRFLASAEGARRPAWWPHFATVRGFFLAAGAEGKESYPATMSVLADFFEERGFAAEAGLVRGLASRVGGMDVQQRLGAVSDLWRSLCYGS